MNLQLFPLPLIPHHRDVINRLRFAMVDNKVAATIYEAEATAVRAPVAQVAILIAVVPAVPAYLVQDEPGLDGRVLAGDEMHLCLDQDAFWVCRGVCEGRRSPRDLKHCVDVCLFVDESDESKWIDGWMVDEKEESVKRKERKSKREKEESLLILRQPATER